MLRNKEYLKIPIKKFPIPIPIAIVLKLRTGNPNPRICWWADRLRTLNAELLYYRSLIQLHRSLISSWYMNNIYIAL